MIIYVDYKHIFFDLYELTENEKHQEAWYIVRKMLLEVVGEGGFVENDSFFALEGKTDETPKMLNEAFRIMKEEFFVLCSAEDNEKEDSCIKALKYIESRYEDEGFTIDELCEFTGVSRICMDRMFFDKFDITVKEHINKLRVRKIEKLLHKGYSAKECMESCGFASMDTMRRLFKSVTNSTPGQKLR